MAGQDSTLSGDLKVKKRVRKTVITSDGKDAIEHGELRVKAAIAPTQDGFRRAGIYFPRGQEVTIPPDTLSQDRYDAINEEPMLVVVEIDAAPKKSEKK